MNLFAAAFLLVNSIALISLPRRWAPLPLLIGTCYITLGQRIELGPFHFTIIRILIIVGFGRVCARGERMENQMLGLDWLVLASGVWTLLSALFHSPVSEVMVNRFGLAYNTLGLYFLIRIFCCTAEDVIHLVEITALVLLPVALEMTLEQITGSNMFAIFGAVGESVTVRGDRLRAQGPFAHAILAGNVGAVCLPIMLGLRQHSRRLALVGIFSCCIIVLTSASSGPLMSVLLSILALCWFPWRRLTAKLRIVAIVAYVTLDIVMKAPAYFLIARIDLTGSSTGWHRAELIRQAILHIDEWWATGTDFTRHWMETGVYWTQDHVDITNHYLQLGVWSGLPLTILFIASLWSAFRYVGACVGHPSRCLKQIEPFFIWSLGAGLLAHATSCVSVSYFDQSYIFLYVNLAIVCSLRSACSADTGEVECGVKSSI